MNNVLWILGAKSSTMDAIESLLTEAGEWVELAMDLQERVCPSIAYRASTYSERSGRRLSDGDIVYQVECDVAYFGYPDTGPLKLDVRQIDPLPGRPPSEFLPASSIGQVIAELARLGLIGHAARQPRVQWGYEALCGSTSARAGDLVWVPEWHDDAPFGWAIQTTDAAGDDVGEACWVPHDLVLLAAADYCLEAACRGECPGVDPEELLCEEAKAASGEEVER